MSNGVRKSYIVSYHDPVTGVDRLIQVRSSDMQGARTCARMELIARHGSQGRYCTILTVTLRRIPRPQ